ncbi:MAG: hypothetical protein JJU02_13465 [Cryomorphaceae bacterium]|nr:hypothetical protein [Cryomorphaceae bacterium]
MKIYILPFRRLFFSSNSPYTICIQTCRANFDVGYNLSEKWMLLSGCGMQTLTLRFNYDDNSYRYNGYRSTIPFGFRRYYDPISLPARVFMGLGGYYTFDHDAPLISDALGFEAENVINGFGLLSNLGITYSTPDDNSGFTLSYNVLGDLSGNTLRMTSGYFLFGLYFNPF